MRTGRRRIGAGLVALLASAALVGSGLAGGPAAAAGQTLTYSPNGPFDAGASVTVTVGGFASEAPVAIVICPTGRTVNGAGDCAPTSSGGSKLITASEGGGGSAVLTVPKGPINNTTPPAASCGAAHPCDFVALNIADEAEQVRVPIPYTPGGDADPDPGPDPGPDPDPGPVPGDDEIALNPAGSFRDGQRVAVVATGFSPNAPVHIGQCADRPVRGPGDCGRSLARASQLVTANEAGVARATITLAYGPLNNATSPSVTCTETKICVMMGVNIANPEEFVSTPILFSGAKVKPKVAIGLKKARVAVGAKAVFHGHVSPDARGEKAKLQRWERGAWVTKKSVAVNKYSDYRFTWVPKNGTDHRWRVKVPKTKYHPTSVSKTRKLVVR